MICRAELSWPGDPRPLKGFEFATTDAPDTLVWGVWAPVGEIAPNGAGVYYAILECPTEPLIARAVGFAPNPDPNAEPEERMLTVRSEWTVSPLEPPLTSVDPVPEPPVELGIGVALVTVLGLRSLRRRWLRLRAASTRPAARSSASTTSRRGACSGP